MAYDSELLRRGQVRDLNSLKKYGHVVDDATGTIYFFYLSKFKRGRVSPKSLAKEDRVVFCVKIDRKGRPVANALALEVDWDSHNVKFKVR